MSEMNEDFDKLVEQINAKLKEAAAALREANQLAVKAELPGLIYTQYVRNELRYRHDEDEMEAKFEKIKVSEFESEMSNAGWSSSSSYC